jgi:hypothetical protein
MHTINQRLIHCRRFFGQSALLLWDYGLAGIVTIAALPTTF